MTRCPKTFLLWTSQAKLLLLAPSTSQHGWQTNWSKHWKIICLQNFSGWVFSLLNFSYKNKMKDCLLDFPSIMRPVLYYTNIQYFKQQQCVVNKMYNIFHKTPGPVKLRDWEQASLPWRLCCSIIMNSYIWSCLRVSH